jgi:hypothetical protein
MTPAAIFAPVLANLVQVKNLTQSYDPTLPSGMNTLTTLSDGQAYWLNMNNSTNLTVTGTAISGNTIHLNAGWNLVGYTPQTEMAIATALANVSTQIIQVKSLSQSYDPTLAPYLNTLTSLVPDNGYWMNMSTPCDLVYPAATAPATKTITNTSNRPLPNWQAVIYPNNTATVYATVEINGQPAHTGDVVAAFINNECVAAAPVQLHDQTAYTTLLVNMAQQNADVAFRIYDAGNDSIRAATTTLNASAGTIYGLPEQIHLQTNIVGNEDPVLPAQIRLLQNYPNPFNPNTSIRYNLPKAMNVDLSVYDMKGRLVTTLVKQNQAAGNHVVQWNGTDNQKKAVASGVYFYKLSSGTYSNTKKMLLIK